MGLAQVFTDNPERQYIMYGGKGGLGKTTFSAATAYWLAKKGKIPPGHQKQLVRQGHFPPGLDYQHLPTNLELRLSTLPEGYVRVMVDGSFVLFNENTRVIFDIIHES